MTNAYPTPERSTDRDAAVDWLMGRINYERVRHVPYNKRQLKLDRMRRLVTAAGSPDKQFPIIHIAGTKGKGSTAAMVSAMLTQAGYRVGVYSSPHLERLEERFSIDGQPITGEALAKVVADLGPIVDEFDHRSEVEDRLTFFDISTTLALLYFAQQQCNAVVLEVGLGGRLDSTNVCLPVVSVITSISFDHTKQLGNTLASIAGEKAGIIKPGVPVVSGVVEPEPKEVITNIAREHGCRLLQRGREFDFHHYSSDTDNRFDYLSEGKPAIEGVKLSLAGKHQAANAAVGLAVIDELSHQGWYITEQNKRDALANLNLPGRIELVAGKPLVVLDTAHNGASARALAQAVSARPETSRTLVIACSREKDVDAICRELLPVFDKVIVTEFQSNPRSVPTSELVNTIRQHASTTHVLDVCSNSLDAWQRAVHVTPPSGIMVIAGSFFLAAELRQLVRDRATAGTRTV